MAAERFVTLGPGHRVPYPEPSSAAATKIGKANKRKDSKCEVRLRSDLHRAGLRFRKDLLLRVGGLRVHPDIVFTKAKVAVFVDGCFWHGCPTHRTTPKSNTSYWGPKLAANEARDLRVNDALTADGWTVIRIWEHEDPTAAAEHVRAVVFARHGGAVPGVR